MALKLKQTFVSQSKSGREIILRDTTGFENNGTDTGYGVNNGLAESIVAHYFVVSKMFDSLDLMVKVDGSNPLLPTPSELAYGAPLTITTGLLYDNDGEKHLASQMFADGVLDVNMYVEFPGLAGVTIAKETNFITGGNFTNVLKGDAVVVGGKIYQIDKSMDDNGGTVVFVLGYFKEDADSLGILYRSNMKVLLTAVTDNLHQYATKRLLGMPESLENNHVTFGLCLARSAKGFFECEVPDYMTATDMMQARFELLNKYAI